MSQLRTKTSQQIQAVLFTIRAIRSLSFILVLCSSSAAMDWVRNGKPVATIVIPEESLPVEKYAASELQYHVERATQARLPIVTERQSLDPNTAVIYLGNCEAARTANLSASTLPGNSYIVHAKGSRLFLTGNDSKGDPLDLDTKEGTLFAVYDLLENQLQIHWLWPGPLGEVIPQRQNLAISVNDGVTRPRFWFKQWRNENSRGEKIWLKRQRFGRSVKPQYGHSFGKYWERFGQTHPEFFNMLPDGTRRLDPYSGGPEYLHMCVSSPGLAEQIIADWKERGAPEFLNVCENDGWAGCVCPQCLAWDEPIPENPGAFDQRLDAARRAFDGHLGRRDEWMLQLGSLSDRYAKFWSALSAKASKTRPDVKVISYIYDNYRLPPARAKLNPNVVCGLVPQESIFGYSQIDSQQFRHDWSGWEATGCQLFLRPNYTLQAPNFPAFYARTLGEDLKFAVAHGLKETDFDSLTGKYSVQGPSLYMLAKILNYPDASLDSVLGEFYAAFGPALKTIQKYFELWEAIYPNYSTPEKAERIKAKRKYGAGLYGPYYLLADEIYTPAIMDQAMALLQKAREETATDTISSQRVEWLAKGLRHTDLLLAAARAYEHGVDTQNPDEFQSANRALQTFRTENVKYDQTNFAGLTGDERKWSKLIRP